MTQIGDGSHTAPRILIVEDDASIRRILRDLVTELGFHTEQAATSTEALALARHAQQPMNLVILDVNTPGITAAELVRAIGDLPGHESTRFLLLSASDPRELASLADGMSASYLAKPFDLDALETAVLNALKP